MSGSIGWRLPAIQLPEGLERDLWIRDGAFTSTPVDDATPLPGRFALSGLVDAHAHLALFNRQPGDAATAARSLLVLREQGVLLVRDVGAPQSATLDLDPIPDLPILIAAGRWLAPEDRFYGPYHRPVPVEALVPSALTELARGAKWIKVIADWTTPELSYPVESLRGLVERVHAAGGRVAAHSQWSGVRDVVAAGVDSIEHGCALDRETLQTMAARGVAWTPTLSAFNAPLAADARADLVERRAAVLANYREMIPAAHGLGVPILVGTDTVGTVVDEIRQLIDYGLAPRVALAAATTAARAFLGAGALDDGASADVVTFDDDPREDPDVLRRPAAIVLRGRRLA